MSSCFFTPIYDDSCGFTEDLRYLDTDRTRQERELYANYFEEQIAQYGVEIEYIENEFKVSHQNLLYGEQPDKLFDDPVTMIGYMVYNNDATILGNFGLETDGDATLFITISSFKENFGLSAEPIAGDLIRAKEYGETNRPNGRGPAMFEVTRRDEEDLTQINPLIGHYVWMIRLKRYDYSYENNVTPENVMNQINDDLLQSDSLTGTSSLSSVKDRIEKTYEDNIDEVADTIFNYDNYAGSNDSVYGDY